LPVLGLADAPPAGAGALAEIPGLAWAARARAACPPVTVSSVTLAAAAAHTTRALAAVAGPGLLRILDHMEDPASAGARSRLRAGAGAGSGSGSGS
jgi:hypothetical protein